MSFTFSQFLIKLIRYLEMKRTEFLPIINFDVVKYAVEVLILLLIDTEL